MVFYIYTLPESNGGEDKTNPRGTVHHERLNITSGRGNVKIVNQFKFGNLDSLFFFSDQVQEKEMKLLPTIKKL